MVVAITFFVFCVVQLLCGVAKALDDITWYATEDATIRIEGEEPYGESYGYGYDEKIRCGTLTSYSNKYRGLFFYDFQGELDEYYEVLEAKWYFRAAQTGWSGNDKYMLYRITEPWSEDDVEWDTCPTYDPTVLLEHTHYESPDDDTIYFPDEVLPLLSDIAHGEEIYYYGFIWIRENEDTYTNQYMEIWSSDSDNPNLETSFTIRYEYYEDTQPTSIGHIKALFK